MSLTITITDIHRLSETERAVLHFIADNDEAARAADTPATTSSVTDALKQTMRDAAGFGTTMAETPVEPDEACSPHTVVIDEPQTPVEAHLPPADIPPPAPPVPTPASAELDAAGLPWDKRIHASTRAKVADGTWRYMRGVDKELVAQVEAELRTVQAIPVPTSTHGSIELDADAVKLEQLAGVGAAGPTIADIAVDVPPPPAAPAITHLDGNPNNHGLDNLAVVPAPVIPPPPPVPAASMTFAQLMQHITPLLVSGKLTQPLIQSVIEPLGIPHLAYLDGRPDLVETVRDAIDAAVGGA